MKFETYVIEIIPRTNNVNSYRFFKPSKLDYLPGQFFFITLQNNGEELKKHFSFSSSPTEQNYIEFTKKLTNSEFSGILKKLANNDWAKIEAPFGKFTFIGEHKKIALLAGGIGITPFRSICRYCTDKQLKNRITLIYGNRTEEDIVFREEFEDMQKENKNLKCVFTINEGNANWKGLTGFISGKMIKKEISDYKNTIFFLCGPPGMVEGLKGILNQLSITADHIRAEYFTGYM